MLCAALLSSFLSSRLLLRSPAAHAELLDLHRGEGGAVGFRERRHQLERCAAGAAREAGAADRGEVRSVSFLLSLSPHSLYEVKRPEDC